MGAEQKEKDKLGHEFIKLIILLILITAVSGCSWIGLGSDDYIHIPVERGDTLYEIGRRYNVSAGELMRVNDIDNPRHVQVGSIIRVPYRGQRLPTGDPATASFKASLRRTSKTSGLRKIPLGSTEKYIGNLYWPVPKGKTRVTSRFGWRKKSFHEGIDLAGRRGTPIYAAHSGLVVYSGRGYSGYGNLLVIRGNGLLTVYAHNDKNYVRAGSFVKRGERIAAIGSSGKASGPHLHFETRVRDPNNLSSAVDPMVFFP